MDEAAEMAAAIATRLPFTSFSLYFFGDPFGRPGDSPHTVVNLRAVAAEPGGFLQREQLRLYFDHEEVLIVADPKGLELADRSLTVRDASRVTWRWYSYGRPHELENAYMIDYRVEGDSVRVYDTSDWYDAPSAPRRDAPAVEL